MAAAKEIRNKIKSIKNTQQITRAMQMVAASKMRRAQERLLASRPYAESIVRVAQHVARSCPDFRHPLMVARPVRTVALWVVASDRGLCGGLNVNLFRRVLAFLQEQERQAVQVELVLIGQKAEGFFKRLGIPVLANASQLGDAPALSHLLGAMTATVQAFLHNRVDAVYLAHNQFVNTMTQSPCIEPVLPLGGWSHVATTAGKAADPVPAWDYLYEPDAPSVLDRLLTRYIESILYQAVIENVACEQAARMVAMKAASDNAGSLIADLRLVYNKARQAQITQELSEIVSGAAAV